MLLATPWRLVESIPRTLQAFMSHRSIANTVIYTAVADTVLPPKADVRVTHRHVRHGPKAVIRKVQQHDGAKKVLAAGLTVQFFAFVYLSLPCDVLVRDLIK